MKVIIIGGGIAGLTAASELIEKGFEVEILEAKSNLGGRVYSTFFNQANQYIDNGQHIMVGAYNFFFNFLKKIGTFDKLKSPSALKVIFYDEENKRIVLDASKLPGKLGLIYGLFAMEGISFKDKLNYIYLYLRITTNTVKLEGTALDFLKKMHQGERLIKIFWEPLVIATINTSMEKASAKLLINVMKKSFFSKAKNARIFIPECDFSDLIDPFKEYFENLGGTINFGVNIKNAEIQKNKITKLTDSKGNSYKADIYIFAIPFNQLIKIFPEYQEILINQNRHKIDNDFAQNSGITSIYLWYNGIFFDEEFCAIIGRNTQWIFNRNIILNRNDKDIQELSITISDSDFINSKSQSELVEIISNEINELFPKSKNFDLIYSRVIKEKNATFTATKENEEKRPSNLTTIANLLIAGDWTNTDLPATLESAAKSGKSTAEILQVNSR
jgi:zeta-carotene desaturase